jgi:hypothetical protein
MITLGKSKRRPRRPSAESQAESRAKAIYVVFCCDRLRAIDHIFDSRRVTWEEAQQRARELNAAAVARFGPRTAPLYYAANTGE